MLLRVGNVRTIFSVMERLNKIIIAVIKQVNACDVSGKEGMYGQLAARQVAEYRYVSGIKEPAGIS